MKKLMNIGFLLAITFCSLNVHADDGGMTTGNRTCTQNCGGLYGGTDGSTKSGDVSTDDSITSEVYGWVIKMMSKIID